ncbi:MAG: 30S ribosomal protein S4 [Dehalococcoidia bacterium]|nr:30S ribosomal protein S4 [Chloroflexota bacterium]MXY35626.1 30S ribosomal protein S4 [Dehalococcoidia bacterium]MCY3603396.1 30S ribosomal protein S4 [Chloroflexota bacterium]MCY3645943.1 30S ribosomal protein S4 [Chloroflexota bacterium]MDE2669471.1 30S ribosomal protein S4 [Chloroflexota bacterium]
MARYTGPVCRICRRRGDKLYLKGERCYSPKCAFERRPNPPGPRPARRRKVSDRGLQLREKQRARATYGVLERQFLRYYKEAVRRPGVSGLNLVRILESRLDNAVYRAGFADSRAQARQIVRHGLITLNGRKTDIPSAQLRDGDTIGFTQRGARSEHYKVLQETIAAKTPPSWLVVDPGALTARVAGPLEVVPGETHRFNENVVIEYYSR